MWLVGMRKGPLELGRREYAGRGWQKQEDGEQSQDRNYI